MKLFKITYNVTIFMAVPDHEVFEGELDDEHVPALEAVLKRGAARLLRQSSEEIESMSQVMHDEDDAVIYGSGGSTVKAYFTKQNGKVD
ncbi:MAG: hypothetical protein WC505_07110 [Patescibacteria group bacterium]